MSVTAIQKHKHHSIMKVFVFPDRRHA